MLHYVDLRVANLVCVLFGAGHVVCSGFIWLIDIRIFITVANSALRSAFQFLLQ